MKKELEYKLDHGLVTRTYSQRISPITLHPKLYGKGKFCIDFRWLNDTRMTKADTCPLPGIDGSVDCIGVSTFINPSMVSVNNWGKNGVTGLIEPVEENNKKKKYKSYF